MRASSGRNCLSIVDYVINNRYKVTTYKQQNTRFHLLIISLLLLSTMEIVLLASLAVIILILIVGLTLFSRKGSKKLKTEAPAQAAQGQRVRRVAGVRNARQRIRGNDAQPQVNQEQQNRSDDEENQDTEEKPDVPEGKIGAKKKAKLEAKAEKKAQREVLERERDDRKKREQLLQEERDKQTEKEREEEKRREEAEKKAREEKERQEYEEYLKMKEAFSVEEEGFEEKDDDEERNLLQDFIDYIKQNKVVILEDLAGHFSLKTASAIERIQNLQADGILTGVIDDRGKFIYISQEELEAVAKFVRQRGRVSITELAEHSNQLINLNPCTTVEAQ